MCSFLVCKNACLNYHAFDLEGDLVGVPHAWYLSAQSFITLLKLIWGEYDIVAMKEWKKKCVGLHRTWVSKRTVELHENFILRMSFFTVYVWKLIFLSGYYHILRNYSCNHCTGALFLCRSEIRLIAKGKPFFCTRVFTAAANLATDLILC